MLIHKYICDICGNELKCTPGCLPELIIKYNPRGSEVAYQKDLCSECSKKFLNFIKGKKEN